MSSRNFASKRSIKPKNNWKIAAALNIDYITFICLSLHTSNCISAPETETYSKNLFDLIRFMWTDLNLNIYKIATKTHTLIISRNVLSVEHNIIRPLSYRSGIETLKIQKKFVKVNVECVVFSSVNSNKFVCFVLFTCANVVKKANNDRLGGRQYFLPASWQHTFGKQSSVLLHGFGCKS